MADWRAEQRVKESLRTGAPMSAADRRVAQGIVDRTDRQRWVWSVWVVVGVVLAVAGLVLGHEWWLVLPGVVLVVVGALWWLLVTRRPLQQGARTGIVPRRVRHLARGVPARRIDAMPPAVTTTPPSSSPASPPSAGRRGGRDHQGR